MAKRGFFATISAAFVLIALLMYLFVLGPQNNDAPVVATEQQRALMPEKTPQSSESEEAQQNLPDNAVVLYFFYGEGCPHCAREKLFLERMQKQYPQLVVKAYEVWHNQENSKLFAEFANAYNIKPSGVPTTFIGDFEPIVGYGTDDTTGKIIEERITYCITHGCIDAASKLK